MKTFKVFFIDLTFRLGMMLWVLLSWTVLSYALHGDVALSASDAIVAGLFAYSLASNLRVRAVAL